MDLSLIYINQKVSLEMETTSATSRTLSSSVNPIDVKRVCASEQVMKASDQFNHHEADCIFPRSTISIKVRAAMLNTTRGEGAA